jgi:hypothetical protein
MLETSRIWKLFARENDSFINKQIHPVLAKDSQKVCIDTKIKPEERAYLNKI